MFAKFEHVMFLQKLEVYIYEHKITIGGGH
jgi:hypothetical protein